MDKTQEWSDAYFSVQTALSDMYHTAKKLFAIQKVSGITTAWYHTDADNLLRKETEHLKAQMQRYEELCDKTVECFAAMVPEDQAANTHRQRTIIRNAVDALVDYVEKCCFSD